MAANRSIPFSTRLLSLLAAGSLMLPGCAGEVESGTASPGITASSAVTVADIEADLLPVLEQEYGEAQLMCGAADLFAGGLVRSVLWEGNAFPCTYLSVSDDNPDLVWVDVLVVMTSDDTYAPYINPKVIANKASAQADPEWGGLINVETADPEWMYRDDLTCADLVVPVTDDTVPGPDFRGMNDAPRAAQGGLSYPEVVYYFLDNGRPAAMDPDGDGRPCTSEFPAAQIQAFYDSARPVQGTAAAGQVTSPTVTTFDIRTAIARAGLPDNAIQVDCALVGPVSVGSTFTCAPRLNQMADLRPVIVTDTDGSYLLTPPASQARDSATASAMAYRPGLRCEQLAAPVNENTFAELGGTLDEYLQAFPDAGDTGLDYLGAVLYFHLNGSPAELDPNGDGWPCEQNFPAEEITLVQGQAQHP